MGSSDLLAILEQGPIGLEDTAGLSAHRRRKALDAMDALIALMDILDGDPDLEPWLGSCNPVPPRPREPGYRIPGEVRCPMQDHIAFAHGNSDDQEEQAEDNDPLDYGEEDNADHEPSLGAPENHHCHVSWARGYDDDREHDDAEREPSLGSLSRMDQRSWAAGDTRDLETDWENEDDERHLPEYREGMRLMVAA